MLPAAKGAANISSSGILGCHKERDLAMSAAHHVSLPFGFSFQQGVQFETILLDDRLGAILLVPIRTVARRGKSTQMRPELVSRRFRRANETRSRFQCGVSNAEAHR